MLKGESKLKIWYRIDSGVLYRNDISENSGVEWSGVTSVYLRCYNPIVLLFRYLLMYRRQPYNGVT